MLTGAFDPRDLMELDSTVLLVQKEERVKGNLAALADGLVTRVARLSRRPERDTLAMGELEAAFNHAGMLLYQAGATDAARTITERAIAFFSALAEQSGDERDLVHLVQPAINLGRLANATGDPDDARTISARLADLVLRGTPARIGSWSIDRRRFEVLVTCEPGLGSVILSVYVIESIRLLLQQGAWDAALEFADRCARDPGLQTEHFHLVLLEARSLMYVGQRRYAEAVKLLDELINELTRLGRGRRLLLYLRVAQIYGLAGRPEPQRRTLTFVAAQAPKLAAAGADPLLVRQLFYRLALAEALAGQIEQSEAHAREALARARALKDEVTTLRCLMLWTWLGTHSGSADSAAAWGDLWRAIQDTHYPIERALGLLHVGQHAPAGGDPRNRDDLAAEGYATLASPGLAITEHWRERARTALSLCGQPVPAGARLHALTARHPLTSAMTHVYEVLRTMQAGPEGSWQALVA